MLQDFITYLLVVFLLIAGLTKSFKLRMSQSVLIAGLNPALQRQVTFAKGLTKGSVNRASEVGVGIGGKGQNVLIASKYMDIREDTKVDVAMFCGSGGEGDTLIDLLRAIDAREDLTIRSTSHLRICTTLVDAKNDNQTTELVEPSGTISGAEAEEMLAKLSSHFGDAPPVGVALMGSMPPGLPKEFYVKILEAAGAKAGHTRVLIDTTTFVVDTLAYCASQGVDAMVKLNARELTNLMGIEEGVGTDGEADSATSSQAVLSACAALATSVSALDGSPRPTFYVGVTDGPYQAHLVEVCSGTVKAHHLFTVPALPKPLSSAIGAGDAVASGTLMQWSGCCEGGAASAVKAFKFGLAVGSASCLTKTNSVWDKVDCDKILDGMKVASQSV